LTDRHLHIICFDIPDPPNYGGVIDMFYKIEALSALNIKIHLHCFKYGRHESKKLQALCYEVYYYERNVAKSGLFHKLPYIVVSRISDELTKNLRKDDYPILFEGLHTCYYLNDGELKNHTKVVRTHNIEHEYYKNLAQVERNVFKRYYFYNEAEKLKLFEKTLIHADHIAAISNNDNKYFNDIYSTSDYIPAFHPNRELTIVKGKGEYALYHGNLSIGENNQAALYLVNEVFSQLNIPLIITGSRPSASLIKDASKYKNITVMGDLPTQQIHELIEQSHINIIPTFQPTGIKLKLLTALFRGRHCIVNSTMVQNTGLEDLCHICDTPEAMQLKIKELIKISFTDKMILTRELKLLKDFSNESSAQKLAGLLF
jgi:hypothetical protein